MSASLSRYLIRLNGAPFLVVTCPDWMEPLAAARAYLLGSCPEDVTAEPAKKES
jgi:hypothetical protein